MMMMMMLVLAADEGQAPARTQRRRRRSTYSRQQLMGCVSGQRSPVTTSTLPHDTHSSICSSRPPLDPAAAMRERSSPRPSKCYRPALSVYSDEVLHCKVSEKKLWHYQS